jgi:hypothetical protein
MKHGKLGGDALEMIMRDVLEGLQEFTRRANLASRRDGNENGQRKKMPSARILYFPRRSPSN